MAEPEDEDERGDHGGEELVQQVERRVPEQLVQLRHHLAR